MEMDANKEIRRAVDTGKTLFGSSEGKKSLLKGEAKLLIVAGNIDESVRDTILPLARAGKIPVYAFAENSLKLGSLCGKPFPISVISVIDEGKSKVLALSK